MADMDITPAEIAAWDSAHQSPGTTAAPPQHSPAPPTLSTRHAEAPEPHEEPSRAHELAERAEQSHLPVVSGVGGVVAAGLDTKNAVKQAAGGNLRDGLPRAIEGVAGVVQSGAETAEQVAQLRVLHAVATGATEEEVERLAQQGERFGGMASRAGGVAGVVGGARELDASIRDMRQHGANTNNIDNAMHGGLNGLGGVATLAGAAGTASVLGAGAVGVAAGHAMVNASDQYSQRTGRYGLDPYTGRNRTGMDAGADDGAHAYQRDLHNGHGEAYAQLHGAGVGISHSMQNVATDDANAAADAMLDFMEPGHDAPARVETDPAAAPAPNGIPTPVGGGTATYLSAAPEHVGVDIDVNALTR
jgi:hypothetical protein